jgi:hypothetical protein
MQPTLTPGPGLRRTLAKRRPSPWWRFAFQRGGLPSRAQLQPPTARRIRSRWLVNDRKPAATRLSLLISEFRPSTGPLLWPVVCHARIGWRHWTRVRAMPRTSGPLPARSRR